MPSPNLLTYPLAHLTKRIIPLPPSTYIHGAELSLKLIIAIVFLIFISLLTIIFLCCICMKRRKMKRRARQRAKEAAESKQLKPRINGGNAKFFAPGLVVERDRGRGRNKGQDVEMGRFIGQGGDRNRVGEVVKRPEKVWGIWKGVLRGQINGK